MSTVQRAVLEPRPLEHGPPHDKCDEYAEDKLNLVGFVHLLHPFLGPEKRITSSSLRSIS